MQPEVTVIIPTYNRQQLVTRAIASSLDQGCHVEIVVIDDGSTDETSETIEKTFAGSVINHRERPQGAHGLIERARWSHPDIPVVHYWFQPKRGVGDARHAGLAKATGQYVKFLDSDDMLLPHALREELKTAQESRADVVVTGFEERTLGVDGREDFSKRRSVRAPRMDHGIDDMLMGQAPWTSAALYRREFVRDLQWDAAFGKADDWAWAWTVRLAGARFRTLDLPSAVYCHHQTSRVSSGGNPFVDSTEIRQRILRMVEDHLRCEGLLTPSRRRALVQYYYKDARVLCSLQSKRWRELWQHCRQLAPGFVPHERDWRVKPFISLFGLYWGILLYTRLRKVAKVLSLCRLH